MSTLLFFNLEIFALGIQLFTAKPPTYEERRNVHNPDSSPIGPRIYFKIPAWQLIPANFENTSIRFFIFRGAEKYDHFKDLVKDFNDVTVSVFLSFLD